MTWLKGFNFRQTSGYVTDGANETYVVGDSYPTTRNGVTFGWESGLGGVVNRSTGVDRRLAGINYVFNDGGAHVFRVDLPNAGSYVLNAAFGDTTGGNGIPQSSKFQDGSTSLWTNSVTFNESPGWVDAVGNQHTTASDWVANNSPATFTCATTILRVAQGFVNNGNASRIAHLFVTSAAPPVIPARFLHRQQSIGLGLGVA